VADWYGHKGTVAAIESSLTQAQRGQSLRSTELKGGAGSTAKLWAASPSTAAAAAGVGAGGAAVGGAGFNGLPQIG